MTFETAAAPNGSADRLLSQRHVELLLLLAVTAAFAFGGSARADVLSQLVLLPLLVIFGMVGWLVLSPSRARCFRPLWWLGGAWLALIVSHLVPMPPMMWMNLPGRDVITDIFATTRLTPSWQPLTVNAFNGWNTLFGMAAPLCALLLLAAVGADIMPRLIKLLFILVIAGLILGTLQVIGGANNSFYLYRITNWESATGLFANRNHNAMFLACGFPLIAAWASGIKGKLQEQQSYTLVAIAGAVALVPAILVTESRAGLLVAAAGLAFAFLIYQPPAEGVKARGGKPIKTYAIAGMATAGALIAALLSFTGQQTVIDRLLTEDVGSDLRFAALPHIWDLARDAFPFGWGAGSFVQAYQVVEPSALLSENYLNQAHNDFLQLFVEFGLPGMVLLLAALLMLAAAGWRLWTARVDRTQGGGILADRLRHGRTGFAILVMLTIGSFFDYPLRTPSLAVLAVIAAAMILFALDALNGGGYGSSADTGSGRAYRAKRSNKGELA